MPRLCVMMVGDSPHAVRKHDKFATPVSSAKNNQLVLLFFGFPYESSVVFNLYTVLHKCRVVMSIFSTSTTRNRMSAPNYLKVGGLISEIMVTTIVNVITCMVMQVCLISNVETHTKFDSPITK